MGNQKKMVCLQRVQLSYFPWGRESANNTGVLFFFCKLVICLETRPNLGDLDSVVALRIVSFSAGSVMATR